MESHICVHSTEIQTDAVEEGRGGQERALVSSHQNRRTPRQEREPFPHWRHSLLLRLRTDASFAAHQSGRYVPADNMDDTRMSSITNIIYFIAGKYFMDFDIPTNLTHLWRYMYHMYHLDAFTQSCPADQDIINHYKLQQVRWLQTSLPQPIHSTANLTNRTDFFGYISTGHQNEEARRIGDTDLHHLYSR